MTPTIALTMDRRTFLLLMLTYGGAAFTTPHSGAAAHKTVDRRTAADGAPLPAGVWAWLRMAATSGEFGIPSSEEDYLANLADIDVVMPLNAGKLQADGEWLQEDHKLVHEWPQSLPPIARLAGHLYMPGATNDRWGALAVLDSPALQRTAADHLVALATEGRFDSPWDGVYLDLEGIPYAYRQQLSDFHYVLAERLRAAGLIVGVSVRGRTSDWDDDYEDAYNYDYAILRDVADVVDMRCYNYWRPFPRSVSPYWWIQDCIKYALAKGVPPQRMTLGLGNFTRYWPSSDDGESDEITYAQAMRLVAATGATVEWVEENENGVVRESFAQVGSGHLWIHDAETIRQELPCVDQYGLLGATLFSPGMGYADQWDVLARWMYRSKTYFPQLHRYSQGGTVPGTTIPGVTVS